MSVPIWAGFECGRLPWNGHDLLHSTGHLPGGGMEAHYAAAVAEGAVAARDGLVPGHDPAARLAAAPPVPVIWDLMHFTRPDDPRRHAEICGRALAGSGRPLDRIIAVNEPSVSFVSGIPREDAVALALEMMQAAAAVCPVRFITCDPIHSLRDEQFAATDALVASGMISVVGVNYYPHHAEAELAEILRAIERRYWLPVILTETSWHDGLPAAEARFPGIRDRRGWLDHVQAEIARSEVPVEGVCWYPWIDMPCWNGSGGLWPCGWPEAA